MRTHLAAPLLNQDELIGAIAIHRHEVRPFTAKQIRLLETFADQAVIAIENVRLFQELNEALEQQTATSEILGVIASSPTDIQPVLDAVASSAIRLCDANDAIIFGSTVPVSSWRLIRAYTRLSLPGVRAAAGPRVSAWARSARPSRPIVVPDMAEAVELEFPETKAMQQRYGYRSVAFTPLLREGSAVGATRGAANRSSSVYGKTNRPPQNLRRPSGDRHRERAVVQGTCRIATAI